MFGFRTIALVTGLTLGVAPFMSIASAEAGGRHHKRGHYTPPVSYVGWSSYNTYNPNYSYSRYNRYDRYRHSRGISKTGAAILGVGVGLLVASAIDNKARRIEEQNYRTRAPYPAPVVYAQTLSTPQMAPQMSAPQAQESACLQTREYQTTIIVGGAERHAYGTACLMPDGSWMMGQATPEPIFD